MTIDFSPYGRPPRLDARGGYALAIRLLRSVPKNLTKPTVRAAQRVRRAAAALQTELKAKGRAKTVIKPIDAAFDGAWTALRDRLAAWSRLQDPASAAKRERAEQLLVLYFSEGVSFVLDAFEDEWVHSKGLLERFEEEKTIGDLERLAGAEFVANVRLQHERLGQALGLTGATKSDDEELAGIAARVSELSAAIGEYTRRFAGEVDAEDSESVKRFKLAMAPLDRYRSTTAPVRGTTEEEVEGDEGDEEIGVDTPIPPAPEGAEV